MSQITLCELLFTLWLPLYFVCVCVWACACTCMWLNQCLIQLCGESSGESSVVTTSISLLSARRESLVNPNLWNLLYRQTRRSTQTSRSWLCSQIIDAAVYWAVIHWHLTTNHETSVMPQVRPHCCFCQRVCAYAYCNWGREGSFLWESEFRNPVTPT